MTDALTNKELVQFAFITMTANCQAKHKDVSLEACEQEALRELRASGVKCHITRRRWSNERNETNP